MSDVENKTSSPSGQTENRPPHVGTSAIRGNASCVQERARIEANALTEEAKHCPEHVPLLYHYDPQLALIVMQYLPPPHDILRRALVAGRTFPKLSAHVATFLARTLFRTSLLALDSKTYRSGTPRDMVDSKFTAFSRCGAGI